MLKRKNKFTLNAVKGLSLIILLFCSHLFSQPFTTEEKKILEMQDKRIPNYDLSWLDNTALDDSLRILRNALAFQNIHDSAKFDMIVKGFNKAEAIERKSVYLHYLSFFDNDKAREFLLNIVKNDEKMRNYAIISLLNIGDEKCLNEISKLDFTSHRWLYLSTIYKYSQRRVGSLAAFEKAMNVIGEPQISYSSYMLSYALTRMGLAPAVKLYYPVLLNYLQAQDYHTRMWSYSALGKLQDTSLVDKFLYELDIEADWRVRVNICNALGNQVLSADSPLREKVTTSLLQHALGDNSAHVSITALTALAKLYPTGVEGSPYAGMLRDELRKIINAENNSVIWQVKAEAIRTFAKIFKDEVRDELFSLFSQANNYDIKAAVVGSFGSMNNALVYKELRDSISNDVMRYNAINPNKDGSMIGSPDLAKIYKAFVEALAELDDRLSGEDRNIIRLILSEFASSKHPAIVDICLTNLQDSMYMQYRGETCQIMMFDYEGLTFPKDKDVTIMYIQAWGAMKYEGVKDLLTKNLKHTDYDIAKASADALKEITGKDSESKITAPKYRTDFDWNFMDNLGSKKIATIKTSQGDIKIELHPNIAPFTVQNFVKLSERGYYNNTVFHRVVPNFVIQGGDPTGTGYGGPGYSIRSEFSPLSFDAYTVGMASSGKDTEGSQFFITHSPQPHLDGRYTLFAKVIDGFDAVDKIQIGDMIESVSFSSN
jgi:cyclophilin family peptidyl-prolyl cis-trans isomerase